MLPKYQVRHDSVEMFLRLMFRPQSDAAVVICSSGLRCVQKLPNVHVGSTQLVLADMDIVAPCYLT